MTLFILFTNLHSGQDSVRTARLCFTRCQLGLKSTKGLFTHGWGLEELGLLGHLYLCDLCSMAASGQPDLLLVTFYKLTVELRTHSLTSTIVTGLPTYEGKGLRLLLSINVNVTL